MKKIVSVIKPFTYTQNIFVYEDGNKIDIISTNLDNLSNTLFEISDKYNTNEVDIYGNLNFLKGIKDNIKTAEMTKYNKNKLNINLISN